jgi:hypothetical protein
VFASLRPLTGHSITEKEINMKASLRKGASKAAAATTATPARSWASRDFPVAANQRKPKAEARASIHFKILSRTGKLSTAT